MNINYKLRPKVYQKYQQINKENGFLPISSSRVTKVTNSCVDTICNGGGAVYIQFRSEKTEKQVKLNKFFRLLHEQLIKNVAHNYRFSNNKNLIKLTNSNSCMVSKT